MLKSWLIFKAKTLIKSGGLIPLDLYAALDAEGVDITELERNARNGA
jgi:hypothetical protein